MEFYYKLVKAGRLTIGEVPIKFRERVQERISGYGAKWYENKRMWHIQWR